jgi:hypothetical protein
MSTWNRRYVSTMGVICGRQMGSGRENNRLWPALVIPGPSPTEDPGSTYKMENGVLWLVAKCPVGAIIDDAALLH